MYRCTHTSSSQPGKSTRLFITLNRGRFKENAPGFLKRAQENKAGHPKFKVQRFDKVHKIAPVNGFNLIFIAEKYKFARWM